MALWLEIWKRTWKTFWILLKRRTHNTVFVRLIKRISLFTRNYSSRASFSTLFWCWMWLMFHPLHWIISVQSTQTYATREHKIAQLVVEEMEIGDRRMYRMDDARKWMRNVIKIMLRLHHDPIQCHRTRLTKRFSQRIIATTKKSSIE